MATLAESNAQLRKETRERRQIQDELERLFNLSMDMLCIAGFDGFFKRLNPALQNFLGISGHDLARIPFANFIHPDDLAATMAELDNLSTGAPTIRFENRYRRRDGVYRWFEWTARPVPEKGLIYANARDVTERKKTQEALRESERRYRTLVEHAPEAIVMLDMESGSFVDCNREAENLFGMPREELLKTNPVMMSPEFQPDGRPSDQAAFEEIGKALQGDVPYFEWVHKNAQGREVPCEIRLVGLPSAGRILVCGSIVDISERRSAEEQLHLTQFMVDSAGDAIFWMHDDARFLNVNEQACRTLGYSRDELLSMSVLDIAVEMTMETFAQVWQAVKEKTSYTFEAEHRRKDGRTFPVEITANYLERNDQEYLCAFVRDITERKHAEEAIAQKAQALERSNTELQQFAYVASHDLQEPLRTISSYVQLLHKRYEGRLDADADDFIEFIVNAAERMQALIRDLLAYSRVGRREINRQPVDVAEVLERTLSGIRAALDAAGAEVTHADLPTIKADPIQLSLLFQNLISNGVKFHGEAAPRVHVSARRAGGAWCFAVKDNGIGIKDVYQERIFEVFRRLHSRSQYAGTGIGLAICKKIIERHGGRIWVESEVGAGSTFFFTIPV